MTLSPHHSSSLDNLLITRQPEQIKEMGSGSVRWVIGAGALLVAALAFYVLMQGGGSARLTSQSSASLSGQASSREAKNGAESMPERNTPALDDIDAESRAAMRDLLREAGEE